MKALKTCIKEIESMGLKNITTARQKKNRTTLFEDPNSGDRYSVHLKTGYVRRHYKAGTAWGRPMINVWYMYQLNPVVKTDVIAGIAPGYHSTQSRRILYPFNTVQLFGILAKRLSKRLLKKS
jgi:hypothetical protein